MENKIQELTDKIYREGVAKGNEEAQRLVDNAREEAAKILEDARKEAEAIDFSDNLIYEEIGLNPIMRKIPGVHVGNNLTINAFIKWKNKTDKTHY